MKLFNKLLIFLSRIIVILICFLVFLTFNDDNVFNIKADTLRLISPQGYAFFTRNPRENQIYIYKLNNQKKFKNYSPNSSTIKMFFGLSRKNNRAILELNEIFPKLTKWQDYDKSKFDYISFPKDTFQIKSNDSKKIKGTFLILREKRIPWAWAKNSFYPKSEFKLIYLK